MEWSKTAKSQTTPFTTKKNVTPVKPVQRYGSYGQNTGSVNLNQYATKNTGMNDLKAMGFDYSKAYANQQAQAEADAQRSGLNNQLKQVDVGVTSANDRLSRDYFQKYLQQSQTQANRGVTGGMLADQNVRLAMNQQAEMGNVYRDAAVQKNKVQSDLTNVNTAQVAKANQIYNDRLQQGFQNALSQTSSDRQENQAMLGSALQQRGQNLQLDQFNKNLAFSKEQFNKLSAAEKEQFKWAREQFNNISASDKAQMDFAKEQFADNKQWREYAYNNMSATEKAQLSWAKEQYGEDAAWRMYSMQYQGELSMGQYQAELEAYGGGGLDFLP